MKAEICLTDAPDFSDFFLNVLWKNQELSKFEFHIGHSLAGETVLEVFLLSKYPHMPKSLVLRSFGEDQDKRVPSPAARKIALEALKESDEDDHGTALQPVARALDKVHHGYWEDDPEEPSRA